MNNAIKHYQSSQAPGEAVRETKTDISFIRNRIRRIDKPRDESAYEASSNQFRKATEQRKYGFPYSLQRISENE